MTNYNFSWDTTLEILTGCCMGDSGIEYRNGKLSCISFTHKHSNIDYLDLKYNILSKYFNLGTYYNKKDTNCDRFRLYYNSETKETLEYLEYMVKDDTHKRVICKDLSQFTIYSLLFYYLDDGSLSVSKVKRKNTSFLRKQLSITLKSYSNEEILKFMKYLNFTFNLNFSPKKVAHSEKIGWIALNTKPDIISFLELFKNMMYIVPESLRYKFCLCEIPHSNNQYRSYKEYNLCNVYKTGICTCRNKDYSECL